MGNMVANHYVHDCPPDTGTGGCPVVGETVVLIPQVDGNHYLPQTPRCVYTHVDLKRVEDRTV